MNEYRLVATLSAIVAAVGAITLLSAIRPLTRRSGHERVLDYRVGPGTKERDPIAITATAFRNSADRLNQKVNAEIVRRIAPLAQIDPNRLLRRSDTLAALSTLTAVAVLTRNIDYSIGAAFATVSIVVIPRLLGAVRQEQRKMEAIRGTLAQFVEQLSAFVASGLSFSAAVDRFSRLGFGPWQEFAKQMSIEMRRGSNPGTVLEELLRQNNIRDLDQFPRLLSKHYASPELPELIDEQSRWLRLNQQFDLTATLEKRAQSVWIPVTVAALVPGIIFVLIPFIGALRTFGQI